MKGVGFIPQRTFSHLKTSVRDQRFRQRERYAGHQDQFVSEDQEFAKLLMDLQIVFTSVGIPKVREQYKSQETNPIVDLPRILTKLNLGSTDQIDQLSKR